MSQINWDEAVFTTASRLIFFFTTVDKYQEIGEISYWTFVPFLSDTGFFLLNSPWCFAFMVFLKVLDTWNLLYIAITPVYNVYVYVYVFSRRFYPKRLTNEDITSYKS